MASHARWLVTSLATTVGRHKGVGGLCDLPVGGLQVIRSDCGQATRCIACKDGVCGWVYLQLHISVKTSTTRPALRGTVMGMVGLRHVATARTRLEDEIFTQPRAPGMVATVGVCCHPLQQTGLGLQHGASQSRHTVVRGIAV